MYICSSNLIPVYYNDGCEKCTLLPLLYRPVCPSDSLRLANQEQVPGSCVSFESLGAVVSTHCRCVFLLRAYELLDQAVRWSCVSFESLGGIGPGQCHGLPASQSGTSTRIVYDTRRLNNHNWPQWIAILPLPNYDTRRWNNLNWPQWIAIILI